MAYGNLQGRLLKELETIAASGFKKIEKIIRTPQGAVIDTNEGPHINFCSNNYLGLSNHPLVIESVQSGLSSHGFGMSSVRFICGTQDVHKLLEERISGFLGTDDTILYNSCFDANAGFFEAIFDKEDVILSDELNHASIVDGVRLCRAQRKIYKHNHIGDLEDKLKQVQDARSRIIATDGVFSMEGDMASLGEICDLAEMYDALVMVDDSHATGFVGPNGKGTPEEFGVLDRVDIITSTLGKALGGASGGFTSGRKEIIDMLRHRSRTYLFSNTIAPPIVIGSLKSLELVQSQPAIRQKLWDNTEYFRARMSALGFNLIPGMHPIVPIMFWDETVAGDMAKFVTSQGIYVVAFNFPVVPKGKARVRVQLSAEHTTEQLDRIISVFKEAGTQLGII